MLREPALDRRRFMCAKIVQYEVYVQFRGHLSVNRVQEFPKLDGAMPLMATCDHSPCRNIECGEERGRSVTRIIVGSPLRLAGAKREQRRGTIESLNLSFLVHAEHERVLWGLEYKPTTSRTLSMNSGSVESLNVSSRCG